MTLNLTAQNSEEQTKTSQEEVQVPEILTKLNLLDAVEVEGHQLTFRNVVTDGRCPKEVTCVWPGEADVIIEINDGTEVVAKKMTIPASGTHKEILSTSSHVIYLKNLAPYPVQPNDKIESYELLIKIQSKRT